ncbi:hypothetical protein JCM10213v2_005230 [Rhodosporidiobolus nylandii]
MALRPFGTLSSVSQSAGTPIRLVEGLCEAAENGDVEGMLVALKRLDGQGGEVNGKSSKTGLSALVTVASKEQSPVNILLLRILRLKGAKLPSSDGGTDGSWLEVVQPWAIELLEESTAGEGDEENEAVKLLTREPAEAKKHVAWLDEDVKPDILSPGFALETKRPPSPVRHPILKLRTGSRFQHYRSTSTTFSSSPSSTPLPPISEAFDSSPIDLTTSRTPSPAPQPAKERLLAPIPRRPLKRAPSPSSPSPSNEPVRRAPTSDPRAHLRLDNLPASANRASILNLFTDTSGVVDGRVVLPEGGSRFALVSFSSTSLAQHASARKRRLEIEGRKVELSLWDKDGQPLADYREVLPVVPSRGVHAAPGTGVDAGSSGGANGGERAVRPRSPYVPLLHRAAELQRRLYFGSLPPEITKEELAALIGGSSGFALERVIFADDDSLWPPTLMPLVLACFEDPQISGVGTSQVVLLQSDSGKFTVWETLAAFRLSIRNIDTHLDGGVPCLSGRTAAYRTMILKDPAFLWGFTNDFWRGRYHLNSGDDKFLTRWLVSHGWRTYIQVCAGAELKSTMKADWTFLKQVLRWTRNTWRSDLRRIFMERHVWRRHPYIAYTMIDKFLNPITLLAGPALVIYLCARSAKGEALPAFLDPTGSSTSSSGEVYVLPTWNILVSWFIWLTVTRTLKLATHLVKRPQDIIYVPVWAVFGYCFSIVKIYALLTLHEVGWGTRAGVDSTPSSSSSSAPPTAVEEEKRASPLAPYRSAAAPPSLQHDRDRDPTPDAAYPSSAPMVTLDNMTSYRLSVSSDPFDDARRAVNEEWQENEERVEGWAEDLETREVEGYEQAGLTPMIRAVEREERGVR